MATVLKRYKPGMTEAQVLAGTLDALRAWGLDIDRQNTGGMKNAKGRYVAFGRKGNTDITGMIPAQGLWRSTRWAGVKLDVEVKREDFNPAKIRGKNRERFDRQLDRMKRTTDNGGVAFWCNNPEQVMRIMSRLRDGWRIEWEGDYPILTDEG